MPRPLRPLARLLALSLLLAAPARAQERGAARLGELVSGLGVNVRVLVVGAHPDDEDTQIIAWLARGRHVETAYLSLTRGDGGQNLIGNELGEALGAIRTEELLAARRVDGGHQFFTRAYDYGFSKNAQEAFTQWPHDSLLRDVVTVVRAFRPHVIISVFTGTPRDGHGQHQAAGILAREAYDAAGDSARFPAASTAGQPAWTPSKFYRGAWFAREDATMLVNVGEFDPLRGRSYSEMAAESRSQHRSQAMGQLQRKGAVMDVLRREASRVNEGTDPKRERSLFEGIDTTWARFATDVSSPAARAALDSLPAAFAAVRGTLDLFDPSRSVPALARVHRLLRALLPPGACREPDAGASSTCAECASPNELRLAGTSCAPPSTAVPLDLARSLGEARRRVEDAIALASGVAVEATAPREVWALGSPVPVAVAVYNRGRSPVRVETVSTRAQGTSRQLQQVGATVAPDSAWRDSLPVTRLDRPSEPWWLATPRRGAVFTTPVLGIAEDRRDPEGEATAHLVVEGEPVDVRVPVVFRTADPARGEINRPIAAAPAVSVTLDRAVEYAQANAALERTVRVHLRSALATPARARVSLVVPAGLVVDSAAREVELPALGATTTATFTVRGRLAPGRHAIEARAEVAGRAYASGYELVDYEHIRAQRLYRPSRIELEAVDVKLPRGAVIAYIPGVGDNVAPALEQLGLDVTVLDPAALPRTDLSRFSAVVVGTRAYEASPALVANNAALLDYARRGGTLVVQYGQYEMQLPGIMPYPVTLGRPADRVSVESAPVRITDPASPLLAQPNRIAEGDFAGWVQDRSLYMPRTHDRSYRAMLSTNDPGEPPNDAAVLVAPLGRGTYVYTTLAFFRQLPAGVPGAARLFVNLLAARPAEVAQ